MEVRQPGFCHLVFRAKSEARGQGLLLVERALKPQREWHHHSPCQQHQAQPGPSTAKETGKPGHLPGSPVSSPPLQSRAQSWSDRGGHGAPGHRPGGWHRGSRCPPCSALFGGPLHPSPGASLHLLAPFYTHSVRATCGTLTFTFLYPVQERIGLAQARRTDRCQLALQDSFLGHWGQ